MDTMSDMMSGISLSSIPHCPEGADDEECCDANGDGALQFVRENDCVDLWTDEESSSLEGLCAVCQKIEYVAETALRMSCSTCAGTRPNTWHLHIGTVQAISSKTSCPGCRLVASLARAVVSDASTEKKASVTISPCFLEARQLPDTPTADERALTNRSLISRMESSLLVEVDNCPVPNKFTATMEHLVDRAAGHIFRKDTSRRDWAVSVTKELKGQNSESHQVRGLPVPSIIDIARVRHWLKHCNKRHAKCHVRSARPINPQPIRLIDVQERQVVSASMAEKYVALSYVWGSNATPILTRESLLTCSKQSGLDSLEIPRTISDAIQLVRDIGERYLWVDSVCIVQDDKEDKLFQLSIMADIYELANLVIVAAAGSDAEAGLPGVGSSRPQATAQKIETIGGVEFITTQPDIIDTLRWTVWNSRGWTFQESRLARRALVFTENLLYWCCQEETWREDLNSDSALGALILTPKSSIWGFTEWYRCQRCRTHLYCINVDSFSWRSLKDPSDALWAFMGILRQLADMFPKGYIWGLPRERLDATLLWDRVSDSCESHQHKRTAKHAVMLNDSQQRLAFPSWSWLSIETPVSFLDPCGASVISEVVWHDPVMIDDGSTTYREEDRIMRYGFLRFTARTAQVILRMKTLPGDEDQKLLKPQTRVQASVHAHGDGPKIGEVDTVYAFFQQGQELIGDLVLLSSNAANQEDENCKKVDEFSLDCGSISHVRGCSHVESRNVMLIGWEENHAIRRGLTQLKPADWDGLETIEREITLG